MFTLHPYMWIHDGPQLSDENERAFAFRVGGLPQGEEAFIAEMHGEWQILQYSNGVLKSGWRGEYGSKEEALDVLGQELAAEGTLNASTIGDEIVYANGRLGRFVVEEIDGPVLKARLFADDPRDGTRIYWDGLTLLSASEVSVIGKHRKPETYKTAHGSGA